MTTDTSSAATAVALQPGEGDALWFLGGLTTIKASGGQTSGRVAVTENLAPRGYGSPLHVHHTQDETLHVISGRFKVRIGEEHHRLEPGGFAYLPAGLPHAFLNLTDEPAELIITFTPGGGHKFFEELAPATRTANPDRGEVAAIFERHGMTLLGPPLDAD